ncbi:MAG: 50S ribosomal protein L13 [Candidatus Aenigmarchaeota archaeon]|nr:50S ribosomal protein L13 [Candidatus Aenigmarchaeota archaeon]
MNVDGKDAVLGRLASSVAKELLKGNEVVIANADKIIITGNPKKILGMYLQRRRRGDFHGPFFPKQPELIVRRAVRGMLPYKTKKGMAAYKRLRVYTNVPDDIKEMTSIGTKQVKSDFIYIADLAKGLGWKQ